MIGTRELAQLYAIAAELPPSRSIFDRILQVLGVSVRLTARDEDRIPETGPVVALCNHPHGLLDGLVLGSILHRRRPDYRFLANNLLAALPEIGERVIPVDVWAASAHANTRSVRTAIGWLRTGGAIVAFPAGEVSSVTGVPPAIEDGPWSSGPARLASSTGATILPVFLSGRNSMTFQWAGFAHSSLRTLLLGRELLNKTGRTVEVVIGPAVSPEVADLPNSGEYLRRKTYVLASSRADCESRAALPCARRDAIRAAVDSERLAEDVRGLGRDSKLWEHGDFSVYLSGAANIPNVLQEIGRLRELTFRAAGEGTGKAIDLDSFDERYQHLFVWNQESREVVAAYRLGLLDRLLPGSGIASLYTSTLFRYGRDFLDGISPGIELGRSFVRPEYQKKPQPLFYLWRGIGMFLNRHPHYRFLFGPVSISNTYSRAARNLIVQYFRARPSNRRGSVKARKPFQRVVSIQRETLNLSPWLTDIEALSKVVSGIESDGKGLPVLLRQYLGLGAEVLEFNVDPQFSSALDALIVVDLARCPARTLSKYLGKQEAEIYLERHRPPQLARAAVS